ncbi:hypothetical protein MLD38_016170 [Melastoma candidum]|uniref:Uncharacterized protein n=1 Tax=Melastoma candidum TaxID=119954 RepID=A0ACB9RI50_9MYRT|nr:hypothetical protein MLD38_016170 [Melastoma candidum]
MLEQDPDFMRWGCRLFNPIPPISSGYYIEPIPQDASIVYQGEYSVIDYGGDPGSVENDEIIAHALQEEFSQLAMRESPGYSTAADEELKEVTVDQQNWPVPPPNYYWPGNSSTCKEGDNDWVKSSPAGYMEGDFCSYPQQPDDDYNYTEMGHPLNQMVPIPHVPRINGEIPSVDEATSDYERLWERLQLYDLVEHKVQGDGNCQFRALSDQIYRTPDNHEHVRQEIVKQLRNDRDLYEGYVPMDYDEYLFKMSQNGEWGDHVTLQAAADVYEAKIFVITSFKDTCYIEILPTGQKPKQDLFLSFWAEVHYNSIYPREDGLSESDSREKAKKWWFWG